jgi:hypothetical protein
MRSGMRSQPGSLDARRTPAAWRAGRQATIGGQRYRESLATASRSRRHVDGRRRPPVQIVPPAGQPRLPPPRGGTRTQPPSAGSKARPGRRQPPSKREPRLRVREPTREESGREDHHLPRLTVEIDREQRRPGLGLVPTAPSRSGSFVARCSCGSVVSLALTRSRGTRPARLPTHS